VGITQINSGKIRLVAHAIAGMVLVQHKRAPVLLTRDSCPLGTLYPIILVAPVVVVDLVEVVVMVVWVGQLVANPLDERLHIGVAVIVVSIKATLRTELALESFAYVRAYAFEFKNKMSKSFAIII